ncbi:MAG: methionyl-tRNA formyltransferase [Pseudonocardiales bacterium]|nr:methionyl-tRNA formyltransferase [Pseudonocardiales bacterium]MBV9031285.1 methionyl-tRNA formyltransferase [Pseudonocardiales bacterium]MBW0011203.1 methionyl-tRNA formyltransferase [Pseudonocardiales bacterium]
MRLVFAGTPDVAVPALRALLDSDRHEVAAVVTRPDAPAGRGRRPTRSPVGTLADSAGLEVLTPRRPSDPDFVARLSALAPDCCPVVGYGALIPRVALDIPRHGWVNLHFSLLPAWRGAAPVQAAIRHGDEITGASTFALEEGLDTGPVYGTVTEVIRAEDTAGELLRRLADAGAALLVATMDRIADGTVRPVPQSADGVSHAPKLTADDARVDFSVPAFAVHRQVRSVTPVPGAWTLFRGQRVGLGPVLLTDARTVGELASCELRVTKREVLVGTATGAVRLGEVTVPGKRAMPAPDWARGARLEPGERFE